MAETTGIEWVQYSSSPWHGCSHAVLPDGTEHPGCANCYAEAMSGRNPETLGVWGDDGARVKSKSFIKNLARWQRQCEKSAARTTVFPSICDPFEDLAELVEWRTEMFAAIDAAPLVDVILLTKRPENIPRMWRDHNGWREERRNNVWLLTSVSDQKTADYLVPELLKCRDLSPVLGLSIEPLLGPIDLCLCGWRDEHSHPEEHDVRCPVNPGDPHLDWVIVGCESGARRRSMPHGAAISIAHQCANAGVPFFMKQMEISGTVTGEISLFPIDLQRREFPQVKARV